LTVEATNLYHFGPLERIIRDAVDFDKLQANSKPIRLCMVQLEDGQIWYMDEKGRALRGHASAPTKVWNVEGSYEDRIVTGVLASSAAPGVYRAIRLGDGGPFAKGTFVDGGVRDVLPMQAGLELGAERIIGIGGSVLGMRPLKHDENPDTFLKLGTRALDIVGNEVYRGEILEPSSGSGDAVERILIHPWVRVHGSATVDPGLLRINIAHGYMTAYEGIKNAIDGWGDLTPGAIFTIVASGWVITGLRRTLWRWEEAAIKEWVEIHGQWYPICVPVYLQQVRHRKRLLMTLTVTRFKAAKEDLASIPIRVGPDEGESIHEWWGAWECHGPEADPQDELKNWDLWSPLPIAYTNHGPIYEGPVIPGRPHTDEF
jgi:hypothetical protein